MTRVKVMVTEESPEKKEIVVLEIEVRGLSDQPSSTAEAINFAQKLVTKAAKIK